MIYKFFKFCRNCSWFSFHVDFLREPFLPEAQGYDVHVSEEEF